MAIPLKLADETTPAYAPPSEVPFEPRYEPWPAVEAEPLGYAGLGVSAAPVRTRARVVWDAVWGLVRRIASGVGVLLRALPLMLAVIAYVALGIGRCVSAVLSGVARVLLWSARRRPILAAVQMRQRLADRRVPYAEAVA